MKRLTKSEITKLRKAAVSLEVDSLYSCVSVKKNVSLDMANRYAQSMGVARYSPAELVNDIPNVRWQLARSLAVLLFIEANR